MAEQLLTPEEFAAHVRKSRHTVYMLLRAGLIKGIKMGRSWAIPRSELERVTTEGLPPVPRRTPQAG